LLRYIPILCALFLLPACGTISGDLKQDIVGGLSTGGERPAPLEAIGTDLVNVDFNLTKAVEVGALLPDDPAQACVHGVVTDLGLNPEAPKEPAPSFTPRSEGVLAKGSIAYIRVQQARRAARQPDYELSADCERLLGRIVLDAARAARRIGSNLPGAGVIGRILD
jgi:hypothetical protein